MFVPKGVELWLYSCIIGWTLKNIRALLANLWVIFMWFYGSIHAILELCVQRL